jgi:hypothetical protein
MEQILIRMKSMNFEIEMPKRKIGMILMISIF